MKGNRDSIQCFKVHECRKNEWKKVEKKKTECLRCGMTGTVACEHRVLSIRTKWQISSYFSVFSFSVNRRVQRAKHIVAFVGIGCVVNFSVFGVYSSIAVHHMANEHKLRSHFPCETKLHLFRSNFPFVIRILFIIYQHWLFNRTQKYNIRRVNPNKTRKGSEGKIKNKICSHRNLYLIIMKLAFAAFRFYLLRICLFFFFFLCVAKQIYSGLRF